MRRAGAVDTLQRRKFSSIIFNDSVRTAQWIFHFGYNTTGNALPCTGYKEARLCNCVKAKSITYSECVSVALFIQHAKRMRRLYCHLWPLRQYRIATLSHKTAWFSRAPPPPPENLPNIKCVFWVSLFFVRKISHYKKNSARYYNRRTYIGFHVKCRHVILARFWWNLNFFRQIFE